MTTTRSARAPVVPDAPGAKMWAPATTPAGAAYLRSASRRRGGAAASGRLWRCRAAFGTVGVFALSFLSGCAIGFPGDQPGDPLDVAARTAAPEFPASQVHTYCFPDIDHPDKALCDLDLWVPTDTPIADLSARYCRVLARVRTARFTRTTDGRPFEWWEVLVSDAGGTNFRVIVCAGDTVETSPLADPRPSTPRSH